MKTFFTIISLLSLSAIAAQQSDSITLRLEREIQQETSDSLKVEKLLSLSNHVFISDIEKARTIATKALSIVQRNTEIYNTTLQKASIYNHYGVFHAKQGNYDEALTNHFKALELRERLNDSIGIGRSFHNIAMIFRHQKDYEKAKSYFSKAYRIREAIGDSTRLAITSNMYGVTYYYNRQNDSALYYYEKARDYYSDKLGKAKVNDNIATLYYTQGDYEKAIPIYQESLRIFSEAKHISMLCNTSGHLAKIYSDFGNHSLAVEYATQAIELAKSQRYKTHIYRNYQLRSFIQERANNHKEALADYKLYKVYLDSVNNIQKAKRTTALELNYQFQKEKLADSLQFANEKQAVELKAEAEKGKNSLFLALLVIALVGVVLLIVALLTRRKLNRARLNKEQLEKALLDEKLKVTTYQAKQVVADNKMRLQFKEEFLEKLKKVKQHANAVDTSDFQSLIADLQSQISTEGKFDMIGENMEQLDKAFDEKLRTSYPDLTKAEREVCALMRMNLSIKEIMTIRNVSVGSIKSSRHRIRKKMGLTREQELEQFISELI